MFKKNMTQVSNCIGDTRPFFDSIDSYGLQDNDVWPEIPDENDIFRMLDRILEECRDGRWEEKKDDEIEAFHDEEELGNYDVACVRVTINEIDHDEDEFVSFELAKVGNNWFIQDEYEDSYEYIASASDLEGLGDDLAEQLISPDGDIYRYIWEDHPFYRAGDELNVYVDGRFVGYGVVEKNPESADKTGTFDKTWQYRERKL